MEAPQRYFSSSSTLPEDLSGRRLGGETGPASTAGLAIDSSGNVEIAGYTNNYGVGGTCGPYVCRYILMMKLDGSGNVLAELIYGSPGQNDAATGVADLFGTMVAVGYVNAAPPYQTGVRQQHPRHLHVLCHIAGKQHARTPHIRRHEHQRWNNPHIRRKSDVFRTGDQIMLRYGDQPKLTFTTNPGTGTITLNGTAYSNGQSTSLSIGNATATATAPSGYTFTGWNATGGVSVSSPTASTTEVTVAGSGTLTARFQQGSSLAYNYVLYYGLAGAGAAATIALIGVILFRRRKKSPSLGQTAVSNQTVAS